MIFKLINIDRPSQKFLIGGDVLLTSAPIPPFSIRVVDSIPPNGVFKTTYTVTALANSNGNTELTVMEPIITPPGFPSLTFEYRIVALDFFDITLSNGTSLGTIVPLEADIPVAGSPGGGFSSLTLPGHGYRNYGEAVDEDLIHLLENFSNNTPPLNPLVGQLWFDSSVLSLKNWNGTIWAPISGGGAPKRESFTAIASQTIFNTTISTVSNTTTPPFITNIVYRNGIEQEESLDYNITGATQITMLSPMNVGERVTIYSY